MRTIDRDNENCERGPRFTVFEQKEFRAVLKEDAESVKGRLIQTIANRWPVLKNKSNHKDDAFVFTLVETVKSMGIKR